MAFNVNFINFANQQVVSSLCFNIWSREESPGNIEHQTLERRDACEGICSGKKITVLTLAVRVRVRR